MPRWSNLSKGSANEWKNQIYLDFSRMQPTFTAHLDFSRMQPTFTAQSDVKVLPFLVELLNHSK